MNKRKINKKRYKKEWYYKYFLKTNSFLKRSGVIVTGKWIYYGIVIGIVTALGAVVFMALLTFVKNFMMVNVVGYNEGGLKPLIFTPGWKKWLILIVPTLGALISGALVAKFAPDAKGHGTDSVIKSFHKGGGNIEVKVPFIKTIATALIIGTGGSAGREGPIAQIGAGFASFMGKKLKVGIKERRIMLLSGAGAGISAIFGAPLGGALFASEVLYRNQEFESEAIVPTVIASIISFSVYSSIMAKEKLFNITNVSFNSPYELIPYTILGIFCAIVGILYVKFFDRVTKEIDEKSKISEYFKPAVGGFLVGALALFVPQILSGGYVYIQQAFDGKIPIYIMGILILAKIAATSFTIGTGGSGGVFAPSLFIGAMLGGTVGGLIAPIFPAAWMPSMAAFVAVGMGGFFAGVARVPIASLVIVSEMAQSYELLVPMMLVSSIAFLLNRRPYTLYREQTNGILDSPAHRGDFEIDVLENILVKDVPMEKKAVITIPRRMPLIEMIDIIKKIKQDTFPVVDEKIDNKIVGIFTIEDIREELAERDLLRAVVADDIALKNFPFVTINENLSSAMNKFLKENYDALPILELNSNKFLGLLTRTDFIKIYNEKVVEMKKISEKIV